MTDKELKKMNRYQLLQLLVLQTERADKLQQKVEELEAQLTQQELKISTLGSIAEASLQLSGVFQAAQEATETYLAAARKQAEEMEREAELQLDTAKKRAEEIEEIARKNAELQLSTAKKQAEVIEEIAKKRAKAILEETMAESRIAKIFEGWAGNL